MYNRLRQSLAFLFALAVAYFGVKSEKIIYWGIAPIFLGELLRLWSAGYIRKNRVLAIVGPYRYVRNPLYVGSLLIGIGFGIFIGNYIIFVLILALFLLVYTLQINSEERTLTKIFGEQYLNYKKCVGRWLPRIMPYGNEQGQFDIKLAILKNKEYNAILGCLGMVLVILVLRMLMR